VNDDAYDIYREGGSRYAAIRFEVRGRDLGTTVKEAIDKIARMCSYRAAIASNGLENTTAKRGPKKGCS